MRIDVQLLLYRGPHIFGGECNVEILAHGAGKAGEKDGIPRGGCEFGIDPSDGVAWEMVVEASLSGGIDHDERFVAMQVVPREAIVDLLHGCVYRRKKEYASSGRW